VPAPLDEMKIAYLEQLLWFTSNIIADSDRSRVDAFDNHIDKLLGIVLHNYHSQFKEGLWRVLTWCLNVLSLGLQFMKEPCYDVFNCFLCIHFTDIENVVLGDSTVEANDKVLIRSDLMNIVHNIIKDASDEQISFVTS